MKNYFFFLVPLVAIFINLITVSAASGQTQRKYSTTIYAVKEDGTLWWLNYKGASDGSSEWAEPKQIGTGWQNVLSVFSSKGKIYTIKEDGTLWWYNHKGALDGSAEWDAPKQVGSGWGNFRKVFSSNGRIYAIKKDGTLLWYDHIGDADGSSRWQKAKPVGSEWQDILQVFDCSGKIYAINQNGDLLCFNHKDAADGGNQWEGPNQVGTGWQDVKQVFGVRGRIYVVKEDGTLWWHHYTSASDGTYNWDTPRQIGTGWNEFTKVFPRLFDDLAEPASAPPVASNSSVTPSTPSQPAALTVIGAIAEKYNSLGGRNDFPGKPLANELHTADGVGRYQKFEHCIIFWHPSIGAHEVHGAIAERCMSLRGDKTPGYPVTDQLVCLDKTGRYNIFQKLMSDGKWAESAIYWSPKTGAWLIYGAIFQKWKVQGAENGPSGYPISAESGDDKYRSQDFQNRKIIYTPTKGAVVKVHDIY